MSEAQSRWTKLQAMEVVNSVQQAHYDEAGVRGSVLALGRRILDLQVQLDGERGLSAKLADALRGHLPAVLVERGQCHCGKTAETCLTQRDIDLLLAHDELKEDVR